MSRQHCLIETACEPCHDNGRDSDAITRCNRCLSPICKKHRQKHAGGLRLCDRCSAYAR